MSASPLTQTVNLTVAGKTFTIGNDGQGKAQYVVGTTTKTTVTATLISLRYEKKMYQPGYICAVIQTNSVTNSTLKTLFNEQKVSLAVNLYQVAKDYIVFRTEPVFKKDSGTTTVYVTLHIYSPDYWMTLDKYSKCYVAKRLGDGIFNTVAPTFGFVMKDKTEGQTITTHQTAEYAGLQYLSYTYKDSNSQDQTSEFIQPYLVQYNESFYDFMVRTANRCGEFFYYEGGKLHLGLEIIAKGDLSSYNSLTIQDAIDSKSHKVTVSNVSRNDANKNASLYATSEAYDFEHANDEYLEPIDKNGATTYDDEFGSSTENAMRWLFSTLAQESYVNAVLLPIEDVILRSLHSAAVAAQKNTEYNKTFLDKTKITDDQQWKDLKTDSEAVSQFAHYTDSNKNAHGETNLNLSFYSAIRTLEESNAQQMLMADLGATYQHLPLGSQISYDGTPYLVTAVSGAFKMEEVDGKAVWSQNQQIEAIPMITPDKQVTAATVYYGIPAPHPAGSIRVSKPQTAFVADNNDPLGYGRVRVRYPWQKETDDASPWIRVTTPFAISGGGACFRLQVDEEVMLDYEGGNIERPFVSGSLFSRSHPAAGCLPDNAVSLSSPNGHFIRMSTPPDATDMATNIFPLASTIRGFVATKQEAFNKSDKACAGGIEMGDKYGFVNISLSTDQREISIKSPFGTVGINAYHGISINAPNGNISISGKNVDIKASNMLSLTSGTNVKSFILQKDLTGLKEQFKGYGWANVGKFFDLSMVKTIIETFIRPVDGTLTVKSYRYLKIEAGDGSASVPMNAFSAATPPNTNKSHDLDQFETLQKVKNTIRLLIYSVDAKTGECIRLRNDVVRSLAYYKRCVNAYPGGETNLTANGLKDTIVNTAKNAVSLDDAFYQGLFANQQTIVSIEAAARSLCPKVKGYFDFVEHAADRMKINQAGQGYDYRDDIDNAITTRANMINTLFAHQANDSFDVTWDSQHFSIGIPAVKRGLLYEVISALARRGILNHDAIRIVNYDDPNDWQDYVKTVSIHDAFDIGVVSILKGLNKGVFGDWDAADLLHMVNIEKNQYELGKWGTEQKGMILLSDNEGQTVSFDHGTPRISPDSSDQSLQDLLTI